MNLDPDQHFEYGPGSRIQILCGSGSETLQRQQFSKVMRPKFTVLRQKSNLADKTEIDCNKETQFSCRYINYTEV